MLGGFKSYMGTKKKVPLKKAKKRPPPKGGRPSAGREKTWKALVQKGRLLENPNLTDAMGFFKFLSHAKVKIFLEAQRRGVV